jgi:hypothetical protein
MSLFASFLLICIVRRFDLMFLYEVIKLRKQSRSDTENGG